MIGAVPDVTVADDAAVEEISVGVVFGVVVAEIDVPILDRLEAELIKVEADGSVALIDPLVRELGDEVGIVTTPVPELDIMVDDAVSILVDPLVPVTEIEV